MKFFLIFLLAGSCLARAQTNTHLHQTNEQQVVITSDSWRFDGNTRRVIYLGHVAVTNETAQMHCGQLTVDLPPAGGHPTNVVVEADTTVTNVLIDYFDAKGDTNKVICKKAIYFYLVTTNHAVITTNQTVTFTGGNPLPQVENSQFFMEGEPLIYDVTANQFGCPPGNNHYRMMIKHAPGGGKGTNASPFNFLK